MVPRLSDVVVKLRLTNLLPTDLARNLKFQILCLGPLRNFDGLVLLLAVNSGYLRYLPLAKWTCVLGLHPLVDAYEAESMSARVQLSGGFLSHLVEADRARLKLLCFRHLGKRVSVGGDQLAELPLLRDNLGPL